MPGLFLWLDALAMPQNVPDDAGKNPMISHKLSFI